MNVCLISPLSDFTSTGVRLLSSILKQKGHEVTSLFLVDMSFERGYLTDFSTGYSQELLEEILQRAKHADLIGISLLTPYFNRSAQLTNFLRQHLATPIIWGGVHPTLCPEECLVHADYVCVGEGEEAFAELLDVLENGGDPFSVPNIWARKNGEVIRNDSRPLIQNLDILPYPDYGPDGQWVVSMNNRELLPLTEDLNREYLYLGPVHERIWTYQILTSRGCPHQCSFCGNLALHKAVGMRLGYRPRSVEHVIGELEEIHKRYEIRGVLITDDAFMAYKTEDIRKFSTLYKEKIGAPFRINATPLLIKPEKIEILVDAGLRWLEIGIQSASTRTLQLFNRQWSTPKRVMRAVETVNPYRNKCLMIYDIILDNPWEPLEDTLETLQLVLKLKHPFHMQSFPLVFYPGTELYQRALREGIITKEQAVINEENMQMKRPCYINFLFSLVGVLWIPRWMIRIMGLPLLVRIGNQRIFNWIFRGIYGTARWLKTVFFRHPTPKDLVINVDIS